MPIRYKELMNNIPGVFFRCACDEHWTMRHMSEGVEALTGYGVNHIVGNKVFSFASLIHPDDVDYVEREVLDAVESHASWNLEYRLKRRDGNYIWVSEQGVGIYDANNKVEYLDGFVADISERKRIEEALLHSEERIRELAYYDSLTGLPNRNLMFETITDQLEILYRSVALLYIDLDRFKAVNDSFGHDVGDETLVKVAKRLQQVVPKDELVARIGGDEFMVLCRSNTDTDTCIQLARNIIDQVGKPLTVCGNAVELGASIGIGFSDTDGSSMRALITSADNAMFKAKQAGMNLIQISNGYLLNKAA